MTDSPSFGSCCTNLYEQPLTRLLLGSSFHPGGLELTKRLASSVALGPGDRVLDLASGRGETARFLATQYGCCVTGIELSAAQVAEATAAANAAGEQAGAEAAEVRFLCGDTADLPFSAGSFDVVFCECALCLFQRPDVVLQEVKRVLTPGGSLALSDVVLNQAPPDELRGLVGRVLCVAGAQSVRGYSELLQAAGFSKVRHRSADDALHRLLEQMSERLARLGEPPGEVSGAEVRELIESGRSFVGRGGMGYSTFTARRPAG